MNYEGKVVLVTGASSGIGEGLSRELHKLGAKVILVARRKEKLESLKDELCKKRPLSAVVLSADISSKGEEGIDKVIDYCRNERIDILINNAGRGSYGNFEDLPIEDEEKLISLNIIAGLLLTHAVIPQMKIRKSGWIINVSSIAGIQPVPFISTYSATKAFNLHHSYALRSELSKYGIKVIAVCPGPVATEFGAASKVPGEMKLVITDSVVTVVKCVVKALETNAFLVTPGFQATIMAIASRIVPKRLSTWVLSKILKTE